MTSSQRFLGGCVVIRTLLCLAALVSLAACRNDPVVNNSVTPEPSPTADPVPWLEPELNCADPASRAEWIVCGNPGLTELHRRLAQKWQADRQTDEGQARLAEDQAYALESELRLCRDAACIGRAYRRYLDEPRAVPTPKPSPTWKPTPRPVPPKARPHRPHRPGHPAPRPMPRDERSCVATVGWQQAQYLSRQCAQVNGGDYCSPRRSCRELREQIQNGCWGSPHKPGFCKR